jgi:hypothetical protein
MKSKISKTLSIAFLAFTIFGFFVPVASAEELSKATGTYCKDKSGQYCEGSPCDCTVKVVIVKEIC